METHCDKCEGIDIVSQEDNYEVTERVCRNPSCPCHTPQQESTYAKIERMNNEGVDLYHRKVDDAFIAVLGGSNDASWEEVIHGLIYKCWNNEKMSAANLLEAIHKVREEGYQEGTKQITARGELANYIAKRNFEAGILEGRGVKENITKLKNRAFDEGVIEGRKRAVEYIKAHVDEMENDQSFNEVLEAALKEHGN